ncbi:MAG: hypothetical protein HY815_05215 [Candidatus Riflebacteria bacterium]|nr:hypothetical protein [Candidatus Riflebacteria bacterium]
MGGDKPGELGGLWLEVVVAVPGCPERVVSREIVDCVGPAAREAKGPLSIQRAYRDASRLAYLVTCQRSVMVDTFDPIREAVHQRVGGVLLDLTSEIPRVLAPNRGSSGEGRAVAPPSGAALPGAGERPAPFPLELLALATGTWAFGRKLLPSAGPAARFYRASPGLLTFGTSLALVGPGRVSMRRGYDILDSPFRALVPGDSSAGARLALGVGVLQTHLEGFLSRQLHHLLDEHRVAGDLPPALRRAVRSLGVPDVMEAAAREGVRLVVHKQTRLIGPSAGKWPADASVRARRDLESGLVLVTPERSLVTTGGQLLGWWRIDPETGNTLGMMASGEGAGLTEYALGVARAAAWRAFFFAFSRRVQILWLLIGACLVGLVYQIAASQGVVPGSAAGDMMGAAACLLMGEFAPFAHSGGGGKPGRPSRPSTGPPEEGPGGAPGKPGGAGGPKAGGPSVAPGKPAGGGGARPPGGSGAGAGDPGEPGSGRPPGTGGPDQPGEPTGSGSGGGKGGGGSGAGGGGYEPVSGGPSVRPPRGPTPGEPPEPPTPTRVPTSAEPPAPPAPTRVPASAKPPEPPAPTRVPASPAPTRVPTSAEPPEPPAPTRVPASPEPPQPKPAGSARPPEPTGSPAPPKTVASAAPVPGPRTLDDIRRDVERSGIPRDVVDTLDEAGLRRLDDALNKWGTGRDNNNQGVRHIIEYATDPKYADKANRLQKLDEYLGGGPYDPRDPAVIPRVTDTLERGLQQPTTLKGQPEPNKQVYFIPKDPGSPLSNKSKGIVVVVYDGKMQSFMNSDYKGFNGLSRPPPPSAPPPGPAAPPGGPAPNATPDSN